MRVLRPVLVGGRFPSGLPDGVERARRHAVGDLGEPGALIEKCPKMPAHQLGLDAEHVVERSASDKSLGRFGRAFHDLLSVICPSLGDVLKPCGDCRAGGCYRLAGQIHSAACRPTSFPLCRLRHLILPYRTVFGKEMGMPISLGNPNGAKTGRRLGIERPDKAPRPAGLAVEL